MIFGLLSLGAGVIGSAIRGVGAYQNAKAQQALAAAKNEAAKHNMSILEENAKTIERDMKTVATAGYQQEADFYKRISQVIGTQAAQMGASGAIMNSGSFAFVFRDTQTGGMEDLSRIRQASDNKQLAMQREADNQRQQAHNILLGGEHKGPSAGMALTTSLIGNLSNVATNFMGNPTVQSHFSNSAQTAAVKDYMGGA